MRVGLQVEQPLAFPGKGRAADVDPTVDVVKDDLEAPGLSALPAGGGDVDCVPALERRVDFVFRCSHVLRVLSLDRGSYSAQSVAQAGQDRVNLVRAVYVGGVDPPLALRQDKGMALLAAERTMSAGLVLEVHLALALERAEEDQVTRLL